MQRTYKCPICGCTEYYEISSSGSTKDESMWVGQQQKRKITTPRCLVSYALDINGDAWITKHEFGVSASVCLCKNCGHIDLFNEAMLEQIKRDEVEFGRLIEEKKQEINNLKVKEKEIADELESIKNRTAEIAKQLEDQDITIRKHNELQEEAKQINDKRPLLERELSKLPATIQEAERELSELIYRLKNVGSIANVEIKN